MNIIEIIQEEINSFINEIGEGSSQKFPYKQTLTINSNNIYDTEHEVYYIESKTPIKLTLSYNDLSDTSFGEPYLIPSFGSVDSGLDDLEITNANEQYALMATIIDIIKKSLINLYKKHGIKIYKIGFDAYDEDEDGIMGNKRERLYEIFIKKMFPNATIDYSHDSMNITLPPNFYPIY